MQHTYKCTNIMCTGMLTIVACPTWTYQMIHHLGKFREISGHYWERGGKGRDRESREEGRQQGGRGRVMIMQMKFKPHNFSVFKVSTYILLPPFFPPSLTCLKPNLQCSLTEGHLTPSLHHSSHPHLHHQATTSPPYTHTYTHIVINTHDCTLRRNDWYKFACFNFPRKTFFFPRIKLSYGRETLDIGFRVQLINAVYSHVYQHILST